MNRRNDDGIGLETDCILTDVNYTIMIKKTSEKELSLIATKREDTVTIVCRRDELLSQRALICA